MVKSKINAIYLEDGTRISICRQEDGKYHFQMDDCEAELRHKEIKELIAFLQNALKE